MKRTSMLNLLLLGIVVLLGGIVWLTPDEKTTQPPPPLTPLQPTDIERIRITNHNGTFVLVRNGTQWQMTEPYEITANTPRINMLLDIVSTASVESFPAPPDRLTEFGLNEPEASIQLNDTELFLGSVHPYNRRRYIRIGNTIHLINDRFPHHLLARAEAFIDHSLLPANTQKPDSPAAYQQAE